MLTIITTGVNKQAMLYLPVKAIAEYIATKKCCGGRGQRSSMAPGCIIFARKENSIKKTRKVTF